MKIYKNIFYGSKIGNLIDIFMINNKKILI